MRTCVAVLAALLAAPAVARGLADVSIIDRDTGERLQAHHHKGEYWVAGRPGAHYSIHIQSREGGRLLAVTSVDGINVVTGETAGLQQRGYVFDAWQGYDIAGWRKSGSEIAAFTFTSIPSSYAARTGRPDNVGVIGVALFRERVKSPPVAIQAPIDALPPSASRASPSAERREAAGQEAAADVMSEKQSVRQAPAPSLGTGHGRREHSVVTQVPFERAASRPDEVIRIRYDSLANLVAMGVVARPLPQPRRLEPFPDSRVGYVPDP